ncbi:MAG TPA: redoxin domain-containing protein, partial [Kiloniellaceae bacterium]|nr:redoxin domain-containing protein [Kiloniellaceae bacterium]
MRQRADAAAQGIGAQPLELSDVLPDIVLHDSAGKMARLSTEMAGQKLLLLFCADPRQAAVGETLRAFADLHARFEEHCVLYLLTLTPPDVNSGALRPPLPFTLLSDAKGQVFHGLGLSHGRQAGGRDKADDGLSAVVADENCRILRIDRNVGGPAYA